MARFFEFIGNHLILSSVWMLLLFGLMAYLKSKSGNAISTQAATILVNRSGGKILDIRERKEFEKGHIVDAINIPLSKLNERKVELEKNKDIPIIVVCQMGQKAEEALKVLEASGFAQVSKMTGGMAEWQGQNLPVVTT